MFSPAPASTVAQRFIHTYGGDLTRLGATRVAALDAGTVAVHFPESTASLARHVLGDTVAGARLVVPDASDTPTDVRTAAQFLRPLQAEGMLAAGEGIPGFGKPLDPLLPNHFVVLVNEQAPQLADRLRELLSPKIAGLPTAVERLAPAIAY